MPSIRLLITRKNVQRCQSNFEKFSFPPTQQPGSPPRVWISYPGCTERYRTRALLPLLSFDTYQPHYANMSADAGTEEAPAGEEGAHHKQQFCSFAVTGPQGTFQAIFVCHTCCTDGDDTLCICQACADECHADHEDLEYVGVGPCYCDCLKIGCCIRDQSEEEAERLNLSFENSKRKAEPLSQGTLPAFAAYSIDMLQQNDYMALLLQNQAQELVKHSKDTFWVDGTMDTSVLCGLERFALTVLQRHATNFGLAQCGAEWWVQVKSSNPDTVEAAIDLHYDKDEDMAEKFGLGYFPTLSTVTYLGNPTSASPTVVFSRRYEEEESVPIEHMLVSHPTVGKHLVFDGRLLHGAPSHSALRAAQKEDLAEYSQDAPRITILVNLWSGNKPGGVMPLSSTIRDKLRQDSDPDLSQYATTFVDRPVQERPLDAWGNPRIELPFLGKDTTWGEDDEDEDRVYVSTVPPQILPEDDTVLYHFTNENLATFVSAPIAGAEAKASMDVDI
jgi:hypothetical protein